MAERPLTAEEVFDSVGSAYEDAFAGLPEQATSLQWLIRELSGSGRTRASIVDVGCGTGRPACSTLAAAGHDVLGIDISAAMIEAARERVPEARFEQVDVRDWLARTSPHSLDAVTVYFSLIADVTQDEIRSFIAGIYRVLKPGGLFVFSTVPVDGENMQLKWMGRPVVVSSLPPKTAVQWIRRVGFKVEHDKVTKFLPKAAEAGICNAEDVWEEPHLFVYARKLGSA